MLAYMFIQHNNKLKIITDFIA